MTVSGKKGRQVEAEQIRRANRAAAVGRLMLGEISSWVVFLEVDTVELEALPRKNLKSGYHDVKKRLKNEIKRFTDKNFEKLSVDMLENLYEQIKAHRGLEIPLDEFESKYSKVKPDVLSGTPAHCTLVFSLWGLQFKFPEDFLAKDLLTSITQVKDLSMDLDEMRAFSHEEAMRNRGELSEKIRILEYNSRCCLLSCFNLLESYLNGIAWNFTKYDARFSSLSKNNQNLLLDTGHTNLRRKLLKYPEIIQGTQLWMENDEPLKTFLNDVKPFRDSLVHPSPFSAPAKFGGYDKMAKFYRMDRTVAIWASKITVEIILGINSHITGINKGIPMWLSSLSEELDNFEVVEDE